MPRFFLIVLVLMMSMGTVTSTVSAEQTTPIVQSITHTIRVPADGSIDEGIALSNEWRIKVLDKNPHMLSVTYLGRKVSESEYKLMVLYEYASVEEINKANQLFPALMQAAWPGEGGAQAFLNKLWKYIDRSENVSHLYETIARP